MFVVTWENNDYTWENLKIYTYSVKAFYIKLELKSISSNERISKK